MDAILELCMDALRAIATLRTPLLDSFFSLVTHLGEETLFIAVALLFYWCIDKKKGYFIMYVGLVGCIVNQWLKLLCCIPRPWQLDPQFQIVESARAGATGFSFPSGHTQSISGIGFSIARAYNKKLLTLICSFIVLLVGFSRMYLGVHTPLDVAVSLLIGLGLALLLYKPLCAGESRDGMPLMLSALCLLSLLLLVYVCFAPLKAPADNVNVIGGIKNAYTYLGVTTAFLAVYIFERKYVKFSTCAVWWAQIPKLAVGLALLLAVKGALKEPLLSLMGGSGLSHSLRYFIAVFLGGGVYPMLFRFLPGNKPE